MQLAVEICRAVPELEVQYDYFSATNDLKNLVDACVRFKDFEALQDAKKKIMTLEDKQIFQQALDSMKKTKK